MGWEWVSYVWWCTIMRGTSTRWMVRMVPFLGGPSSNCNVSFLLIWSYIYIYIYIYRMSYSIYFLFLLLSSFLNSCGCSNGQVEDSTAGDFFYPLNSTEHRSQPSLTTRDRELVSLLEVRIKPGIWTRDLWLCSPSLYQLYLYIYIYYQIYLFTLFIFI